MPSGILLAVASHRCYNQRNDKGRSLWDDSTCLNTRALTATIVLGLKIGASEGRLARSKSFT